MINVNLTAPQKCNDSRPCFMRSTKKYPGCCYSLSSTYDEGIKCPFCKAANEDMTFVYEDSAR